VKDKNLNLTVVHSNELIEAGYSLSTDEMRLLNLALTKIDSRKSNPGLIDIYPSEFAKMYNLNERNVWRNMKKAIQDIMSKPISLYKLDDQNKEKVVSMPWLVESEYYVNQDDGSRLSIEFSPKITPYLFELKNRFTALDFEYVGSLNTQFSYRLYTWLMKYKFLEKYKTKHGATVVELDIDWMKSRAGMNGSYERWDKFRSQVIVPAVEQINAKTDISLLWDPIKKGGKAIKAISFVYALEKTVSTKPERPRLFRRPKVEAGSHAEGEWMRKNFNILSTYKKSLEEYDPAAKIEMVDFKRMIEYAKDTGQTIKHTQLKNELKERLDKRKNKKGVNKDDK